MRGKNHSELKAQNMAAVKRTLYRSAPISRVQLAEALGLTPATITNLTAEMIERGEIRETETGAEKGRTSGRRPIALDLVPSRFAVLGISLGRYRTAWCVTDLRGRILLGDTEDVMPEDYGAMLEGIAKLLERVRSRCGKAWDRMLGIGIAVPGIVDSHRGVVKNHGTERYSWVDRPLGDDVSALCGLPVRVDNNVRARACAVDLFHPELRESSRIFAFCHVSWGIACPLMLGDTPFRGEDAAGGEMGKMKLQVEGGTFRTLESLAGAGVIMDRCREMMERGEVPVLSSLCAPEDMDMRCVLRAQRMGDAAVDRVLTEAMAFIGVALSNIINIIDPHLVFLSGEVFRSERNVDAVRRAVRASAFLPLSTCPRIVPVDLGELGGAVGSAACCIEKHYIRGTYG